MSFRASQAKGPSVTKGGGGGSPTTPSAPNGSTQYNNGGSFGGTSETYTPGAGIAFETDDSKRIGYAVIANDSSSLVDALGDANVQNIYLGRGVSLTGNRSVNGQKNIFGEALEFGSVTLSGASLRVYADVFITSSITLSASNNLYLRNIYSLNGVSTATFNASNGIYEKSFQYDTGTPPVAQLPLTISGTISQGYWDNTNRNDALSASSGDIDEYLGIEAGALVKQAKFGSTISSQATLDQDPINYPTGYSVHITGSFTPTGTDSSVNLLVVERGTNASVRAGQKLISKATGKIWVRSAIYTGATTFSGWSSWTQIHPIVSTTGPLQPTLETFAIATATNQQGIGTPLFTSIFADREFTCTGVYFHIGATSVTATLDYAVFERDNGTGTLTCVAVDSIALSSSSGFILCPFSSSFQVTTGRVYWVCAQNTLASFQLTGTTGVNPSNVGAIGGIDGTAGNVNTFVVSSTTFALGSYPNGTERLWARLVG